MTDVLQTIHPWLGYAVFVALAVAALVAFNRAKYAREFSPGLFIVVMVAVDIQILLGLIQYVLAGAWDARAEIAYLHPIFAIAALAVGHAALRRGRNEQMAIDANKAVGRGMLICLVLLLGAIGVASAPPFL